jgi:hypothetical protein
VILLRNKHTSFTKLLSARNIEKITKKLGCIIVYGGPNLVNLSSAAANRPAKVATLEKETWCHVH